VNLFFWFFSFCLCRRQIKKLHWVRAKRKERLLIISLYLYNYYCRNTIAKNYAGEIIMSNYVHLSLTDRCIIERCMSFGYSMKETASMINRHPSTVSREIRNHRIVIANKFVKCSNYSNCLERKICDNKKCMIPCKTCKSVDCREICVNFMPRQCKQLKKPPYICNNCSNRDFCQYEQAYYHARKADIAYHETLSDSRKGVHADEEQLARIDKLITPLIKNGQSLNHIFATHSDELKCSRKTMYNHIDRCILTIRNIDLPRKVRYKRRKSKPSEPCNQQYRKGRTYEDFKAFIAENPDVGVVEMDTVKGRREAGKVMLTMVFVKYDFIMIFLLDACTQECVTEIFQLLLKTLGINVFRRIFLVILTDNGSEFKNPAALEINKGIPLTRIFYCDPHSSFQKPHIERQHELVRRVIPKGRSLDDFSQEDMTMLTNHVNNYCRDSLDGNCPYVAARLFLGTKIPLALGFKRIKPDDVILNPSLLKK